ncbi:hypothetical protein BKA66DRAFT_455884 [Pyrenochaeta sp. MPI-SDFR-AT-0127]|nr:hypothetical protein BKA66DRAFT_455884 [Pyrenochaeta sp. MPI-SDFR-AT-0127]
MIFRTPPMFWLLLSTSALAQRIPEILSTRPELSSLSNYISSFPSLEEQFSTADNFTFLAPTNDAFTKWLATNRTADYMEATFMYHLLRGVHTTVSINETPQFISSFLTNASFSNVTNGQRVGAFRNEHVLFESALKTTSTVVTGVSYFIEIASQGNFLSVTDRPLIDSLLTKPDKTLFLPNSAKALANILSSPTFANATLRGYMGQYTHCSKLVFSTDFVDGALVMTDAGVPVVVTVLEGKVYINNAKVLERDVLITNGVFHIIDDALNPYNITTPSKKTNQTASSTAPTPTSTSTSAVSKPKRLSTAAKVIVGLSASAAGIFLIVTAYIAFRCLRKRTMGTLESGEQDGSRRLVELSSSAFYELHQREQAVELPERKHEAVELPAGDSDPRHLQADLLSVLERSELN